MSKRLIALFAFAFVVATSMAAYAEVQNVKVGGDVSILAFDRNTFNLRNIKNSGTATDKKSDYNGLASIAHVKIMADLTDAVSTNIVLVNEQILGAASQTLGEDGSVAIGQANVTLKDMFGQPFTMKAGIMPVSLGSALVLGAPAAKEPFATELDGFTTRKSFSGFVGILDLKPITLTGAALKVTEGTLNVNNDDVNAYAINAAYDLAEAGMKGGVAEAYWIEKNAHKAPVDNYGIRAQTVLIDNLNVGAEFCYQREQFADANTKSNNAWLANASYTFADVAMTPMIGVDFTRLSKNWDVMLEDMAPADIADVLLPNTNVTCYGINLGAKPMEDLSALLRFASLRSVKPTAVTGYALNGWANYDMDENRDLGKEWDLHLTYDYTEDVQFGLMGGYFIPGKAFSKSNRKDASQVIGSMKVSF